MEAARLTPTARGILWAVLSMVAFATIPIGVRFTTPHLPAAETVMLRNFLAVALMLPWVLGVGWRGLRPKRFDLHLLRGTFNGIGMILWFWGLGLMPVADAVAIQFTLPLFALIFAVVFLGERVGLRRSSAALVGFAGALIIIRPGFAEVGWATAAVLGSAALYAATLVVMRSQSQNDRPLVIMFWSNLFIGLVAVPPAALVWVAPPPAAWPWLLFLACGGWLAHFSLTKALVTIDAKVAAPMDYLRLPFVVIAAYPLFGEFPDAWTWVGAAVIAASTTYIANRDARLARERRKDADARRGEGP
ncbi:MAG: DMT family transporter [Alphaproteobacteria bacterium]|nr:DMT family transporter [Alphaproteobacteria bacterium]